jgi:hypothetical protein
VGGCRRSGILVCMWWCWDCPWRVLLAILFHSFTGHVAAPRKRRPALPLSERQKTYRAGATNTAHLWPTTTPRPRCLPTNTHICRLADSPSPSVSSAPHRPRSSSAPYQSVCASPSCLFVARPPCPTALPLRLLHSSQAGSTHFHFHFHFHQS